MANKSYKNITIKIDNASQTLTDISCYVNQHSLQGVLSQLEDSAFCDGDKSFIPGIHGLNGSLNGYVNSTTDAIFGPLLAAGTSVNKTYQFGSGAGSKPFIYGEIVPGTTQYSGQVDQLQMFSFDFVFDGAATRTSVTQA